MIIFDSQNDDLILTYASEMQNISWIDTKLNNTDNVNINRVFSLTKDDLIQSSAKEDSDYEVRHFVIGSVDEKYQKIRKEVLGLKHDLLIAITIPLRKELFVATKNVSIFKHIDDLISEQIIIGGDQEGAIPEEEFRRLLKEFPTTTELARYTDTRIAQVLGEYLETMSDAERRLSNYMKHRQGSLPVSSDVNEPIFEVANDLELEKFIFVRDRLKEMLKDPLVFHETYWQKLVANLFLLIFPQYINVLENVSVKEYYSHPPRATVRKFDLVLVNANGCIDIIEIKKPFADSLVSTRTYRDNYIPRRELSGSIMQAEKYLFYLNKGGREIEQEITVKYKSQLPTDMEIRVASPKAIILNGRDDNLSKEQKNDLEFIRKKYSNMVDILSYDDLLRRLDNLIVMLSKRSASKMKTGN